MVEREVIDTINKYIAALREKGILFERIILFGSSLKGRTSEWNDIDVAVISPEFGNDILKERLILAKIAYHVDPRLDVHPVGAFEFENESWKTVIHEIKTTGVEIAA